MADGGPYGGGAARGRLERCNVAAAGIEVIWRTGADASGGGGGDTARQAPGRRRGRRLFGGSGGDRSGRCGAGGAETARGGGPERADAGLLRSHAEADLRRSQPVEHGQERGSCDAVGTVPIGARGAAPITYLS